MKVEQTWRGNKYDIFLYADDSDDLWGLFELTATSNERQRKKSCITTLNFVIGQFIRPILGEDEEVEDSTLIVHDRQQFEELVKHTINLLDDQEWCLRYLEPALDEDRQNGEWEDC